jgi:DNA modification methylase
LGNAAERGFVQSGGTLISSLRPQDGNHDVIKPKDLVGIPWRVAFALQADGWYLRQDIIWAKPNPMPESVRDRCTKAHDYLFLLAKSERYYFDAIAIAEDAALERWGDQKNTKALVGAANLAPNKTKEELQQLGGGKRNKRSVWTVPTASFKDAHFATFPPTLIEPCILAGASAGGVVLDPFMGSGTAGEVALKHGRAFVGIELNETYFAGFACERIKNAQRQQRMFD